MKALVSVVLWHAMLSSAAAAMPSQNLADACLAMKGRPGVSYTELPADHTHTINHFIEEDGKPEVVTKKSTVAQLGSTTFGVWESVPPETHGLVYNGHDIDLDTVIRLKRRQKPGLPDMDRVQYGSAREGRRAYLCATYNVGEPEHNRMFGPERGVYLIDRKARTVTVYVVLATVRK